MPRCRVLCCTPVFAVVLSCALMMVNTLVSERKSTLLVRIRPRNSFARSYKNIIYWNKQTLYRLYHNRAYKNFIFKHYWTQLNHIYVAHITFAINGYCRIINPLFFGPIFPSFCTFSICWIVYISAMYVVKCLSSRPGSSANLMNESCIIYKLLLISKLSFI